MAVGFLLNHLWQSTAFAALIVAVAWALRRQQARVRFGLYLAASLKFLVPFSALVALGRWLPWAHAARAASGSVVTAVQPVVLAVSNPFGGATVAMTDSTSMSTSLFPALLLGIWALGTLLLVARWAWRWFKLARIARRGEPRELAKLPAALCDDALEPGVFGVFRPVLLLPRNLASRLTADEFAAVLAHERCHLRRQDNLWSALHSLVECLFWFHPGVWWLGRRLVEERERACDEAVLTGGGDREAYASGILSVCRYYAELPPACAAGVSGGELRKRVAGILHGRWGERLGVRQKTMLCGLVTLVVAAPLAVGLLFGQATPKRFDAASIHPSKSNSTWQMRNDTTHFTAEHTPLQALILAAFDLQPYQLQAPGWMNQEQFNISAETATPVSDAAMLKLLRPYLVRQFGLRYHESSRAGAIDELHVASGGLKLEKATVSGRPGHRHAGFNWNVENGLVRVSGTTDLGRLAKLLGRELGRPVVDKTHLTGIYKLDFSFKLGSPVDAGANAQSGDLPSLPEASAAIALIERTGLQLVSAKGPIKVLVIDHANRTPVGN